MALAPLIREFLNERRFAVLATINSDGTPQQTTMWYELRGDIIVMNTTATRLKSRNLARDTRVSVCIENGYRYVTIVGEAELVNEQAIAQEDIHRLAARYNGEEIAAHLMAEQFSKQERVSIYLPVERVVTYGFE
ncbi:MAG TPA: PPOX class F420-dependent oxidoreductase [Ktedonobacterales bacterium]|nr:PPOX class F420-dependent oxidoreductase [Ktedonobacterales bacterium]